MASTCRPQEGGRNNRQRYGKIKQILFTEKAEWARKKQQNERCNKS